MRSIIKVGLRVIIIVLFIRLLYTTASNLSSMLFYSIPYQDLGQDSYLYLGIYIAVFLASSLVLYMLWRKTDWLVKILAGDISDNELVIKSSNMDVVKVAMRILGIYLLITSIPELIGLLGYHISLNSIEHADAIYTDQLRANALKDFLVAGITLMIGAWLLLGSKGISRAIDHVLNAPITEVKEE